MLEYLKRFHRFLVAQSLYPLVLSSLLALSIYMGRVIFSESWLIYANMVKNLFLAWLPYLFSFMAVGIHKLYPKGWWLLPLPSLLWLLFFPNAPYMVTDFYHLEERPGIPLWYDILMLASFSLTGLFLTIASLRGMQSLVRYYLGGVVSWLFAAFTLSLAGLGIYLGRIERWNSWDLLLHPKGVLKDIASRLVDPFSNLRFFGFTLGFTAFLVVCYLMFISMRRLEE